MWVARWVGRVGHPEAGRGASLGSLLRATKSSPSRDAGQAGPVLEFSGASRVYMAAHTKALSVLILNAREVLRKSKI